MADDADSRSRRERSASEKGKLPREPERVEAPGLSMRLLQSGDEPLCCCARPDVVLRVRENELDFGVWFPCRDTCSCGTELLPESISKSTNDELGCRLEERTRGSVLGEGFGLCLGEGLGEWFANWEILLPFSIEPIPEMDPVEICPPIDMLLLLVGDTLISESH